jgi:hypothetical protein
MPEVSQYSFSHVEVLELLIKKADLHEGKWQLIINFTFAAANAGPTPADIIPSAFVGVASFGLTKAGDQSPPSLTLDAGVVNPAST